MRQLQLMAQRLRCQLHQLQPLQHLSRDQLQLLRHQDLSLPNRR
jgi:hypothetical protein